MARKGERRQRDQPSRRILFTRLLRPNSDLAIGFHTGTTGLEASAFNIGDRAIPDVKTMLDLYPVRQIWDNSAYPGVLHNAFIDAGIPSFCPEVGAARALNLDMVQQFVEGTMNVLKHYGVVPGPIGRTAADVNIFIGRIPDSRHAGRVRRAARETE
jgi:predicted deacylase